MKLACRTLFVAVLIGCSMAHGQEVILDTGPIASRQSVGLGDGSWEATRFVTDQPSIVTSVEGFLYRSEDANLGRSGVLKAALFANGPNGLPSERLFEQPFSVPNSSGPGFADWHGVSNLNWNLEAGTYWVAIVADEPFSGGMSFDTDLDAVRAVWFDFDGAGPDGPTWGGPFDGRRTGFRVNGRAIPEPSTYWMIVLGLVGMHCKKRPRCN